MKKMIKKTLNCLNIVQLVICVQFIASTASAMDASLLDPTKEVSRAPANFTPSDDLGYVPLFQATITTRENMLQDDRSGNLARMRNQITSWEQTDEYANDWDIKSTGLYNTADDSERRKYVQKYLLKYVDKRIGGQLKKAKKGSTLASVRKVEQALKPDTKVRVSKNVRVRFSAKVLEQYGRILVQNPYVESKMFVHVNGQMNIEFSKNVSKYGLRTNLNYKVSEGRMIASVDKTIGSGWSARVSSDQYDKKVPFQENATFQLFYGLRF